MKSRSSKESAYFIILKKLLVTKDILQRKDFEIPKVKGKTIVEEMEPKTPKEEYVPHSTLISRLDELKKMEAITEIDTGKKAKTQLMIPFYHLTFIGMIKLLQLCDDKKFDSVIFHNLRFLDDVNFLPSKKILSNKQIFEILVYIAKNTTIIVKQRSEINTSNFNELLEHGFVELVTTSEIMDDKEDRIIYYVEIKRNYRNFSYILKERIPIYGKRDNDISIIPKDITRINKILTTIFYDEIIQRCNNAEMYPEKCTSGVGVSWVYKVIREDKDLRKIFLEYLGEINERFKIQKENVSIIRSAITRLN